MLVTARMVAFSVSTRTRRRTSPPTGWDRADHFFQGHLDADVDLQGVVRRLYRYMAERVVKPAPLPCRGCERARRCAPGGFVGQCIEIQDRVVRPTGYRGGFHRQPLAGCFTRRDGHHSDCTQPLRLVTEVGAARRCPVPIVHRRLIMLLLARVEGCVLNSPFTNQLRLTCRRRSVPVLS